MEWLEIICYALRLIFKHGVKGAITRIEQEMNLDD